MARIGGVVNSSLFLTAAAAGYDGDPNDPGASVALQEAPVGTWYLRETPILLQYRKVRATAFDGWKPLPLNWVEGNLTINVDQVVGTTNPAPGSFITQADVDAFEDANGPAQDLEAAIRAFASVPYGSTINIAIAAGLHRPDAAGKPSLTSWDMSGILNLGTVNFNGALFGSWSVQHSINGAAIAGATATTVTSTGTFTGLDLRGLYARIDGVQVSLIVANDNDTITVLRTLSPVPTPAVDTLSIVKPSSILRNSLDDINTANFIGMRMFTPYVRSVWNYNDLCFEFGGDFSQAVLALGGGDIKCNRMMIDMDVAGLPLESADGTGWQLYDQGTQLDLSDCCWRALSTNGKSAADWALEMASGEEATGNIAADHCGFFGGRDDKGSHINAPNVGFRADDCVFDDHRVIVDGIIGGSGSVFRSLDSGLPSLELRNRARSLQLGVGLQHDFTFEGITGAPAVQIKDGAQIDQTIDFLQGAVANTDVGIEVTGSYAKAELSSLTDVTGTVADTRISGTTQAYASLPGAANPILGVGFNVISKEP